jgi:hypothetical protein
MFGVKDKRQVIIVESLTTEKMVWLLDCWTVHKSKKKLDWVKKKHSTILVIYVLTNCTNVLQHVDVILQYLLKHAFKMTFNSWTTNIINSHIDTSANIVNSK